MSVGNSRDVLCFAFEAKNKTITHQNGVISDSTQSCLANNDGLVADSSLVRARDSCRAVHQNSYLLIKLRKCGSLGPLSILIPPILFYLMYARLSLHIKLNHICIKFWTDVVYVLQDDNSLSWAKIHQVYIRFGG